MHRAKITKLAAIACVGVLAATTHPGFASVRAAVVAMQQGLHPQMHATKIYSDTADAKADIRQAIHQAAAEHKRVILDFGGNWCGDCQVLNIYFHNSSNASLLAANYVLVDVNIGKYDKNLDVVQKYGIPLNKGVPALVVLDGSGHVLYAQRNAEFEKMRKLDSSVVTAFLEKWKPQPNHRRSSQAGTSSGIGH